MADTPTPGETIAIGSNGTARLTRVCRRGAGRTGCAKASDGVQATSMAGGARDAASECRDSGWAAASVTGGAIVRVGSSGAGSHASGTTRNSRDVAPGRTAARIATRQRPAASTRRERLDVTRAL